MVMDYFGMLHLQPCPFYVQYSLGGSKKGSWDDTPNHFK